MLILSSTAAAQEEFARETAGWHILRPGESLEAVSQLYLGDGRSWGSLIDWNPGLERPSAVAAGDRVRVPLESGLPQGASLVSQLSGDVLTFPSPVEWTPGRIFDLLQLGDGVRTLPSAAVELTFEDSSRLRVSEDSLIFLGGEHQGLAGVEEGDIEIVRGQVDLRGESAATSRDDFEILLGGARLEATGNGVGIVRARARLEPNAPGQVMVFQGSGRVSRGGQVVSLREGSGVVVPRQGPPSSPESLLQSPTLSTPAAGDRVALDRAIVTWERVPKADTYTVEICHDPRCSQLALRGRGVHDPLWALPVLPAGEYFWRVSAVSASGLDGYPSASRPLDLELPLAPEDRPATIVGIIRDRLSQLPLAGASIQILEQGTKTMSNRDGRFELSGLAVGSVTLEASLGGFLPVRLEQVPAQAGSEAVLEILLDGLPTAYAGVLVTPSQISLGESSPSLPVSFSRKEIEGLPHLADDLFRALPLLPGTTANDISAEFHVRGGHRDQVEARLDGQELYEAYHLRDFDGALSIVGPSALGSVDLRTGGYPVQFGDRLSAVLEMHSAKPDTGHELEFGLGVLTSRIGSRGTFHEGAGQWLAIGRSGSTQLAREFLAGPGPEYWDLFAKSEIEAAPGQYWALRSLVATDRLDFHEVIGEESKEHRTQHDNSYFWGSHQAILNDSVFVDTRLSWSILDKDRIAREDEEEQTFDFLDRRRVEIAEARQEWSGQFHPQHLLSWGLGLRHFLADYSNRLGVDYDTPVAVLRTNNPETTVEFEGRFEGDHWSAYLSDQWRPRSNLSLEIGARLDRLSLTDETLVSPRLSLAWVPAPSTVVRASWGRYHQSHRAYELAVGDGERTFHDAERLDSWILGLERSFSRAAGARRIALRIEAYQRQIDSPRPRFENLFEPYNNFPELEPERVRVAPRESRSRGIEIFVRGATRGGFDAWANYTWATSEDRLEEGWVPRMVDQTHALNLGFSMPLRAWVLTLTWRYHTGWPTTPIVFDVESDAEGEFEWTPVLGPRNQDRLVDYHRLDLRLSRSFDIRGGGRIEIFADVQNLYDRRNLAGFDFEFDDATGAARKVPERWPGVVPSLGIGWRF